MLRDDEFIEITMLQKEIRTQEYQYKKIQAIMRKDSFARKTLIAAARVLILRREK